MKTTGACPQLAEYQKLATGRLSPPEKEAVLDHLEGCIACVQRIESLSEKDTLVDLIRQARTIGEGPPGETVARLVEGLRKLRPSAEAAPKAPGQIRLACSGCGKTLKVKGSLAGKKVKCSHCQAVMPVPATLEPQGQDSPRPSAPEGDEAMTLAPTGPVGGRSAAGTQSHHGAGPSQPARKELHDFLAPAQAPDELGRLGPYRVLKVLGAGGMGVVFQAEDPQLQRIVALKAMLPGLAASDSAKQRFLREARAAAALKHDHIVTIHQVGEDRGAPYLAMEFLEGEPLEDRLQRVGKLPLAEVLRIGREMAEGLGAAHERGLIHRDIKPANVWLEGKRERVKILDFGLARAATDEALLTQPGAIVGTPAYMAPEQAQGKNVEPRCDLFSLGCVLYRMATGAAPFRGTDLISTLMAVSTENPTPPVSLNLDLPRDLSDFILKLLAKEPKDRPESAQAVAAALQEMAREVDHQPASSALTRRPAAGQQPPRKKWPILAGVVACLLLLVLAGLWGAGVFRVQTSDGTIVLENVPADAEVLVDGNQVTLKLADAGQWIEIKAPPGQRKLEIKAAGFKVQTQEVTIVAGARKPISIRLVPLDTAPKKTDDVLAKSDPLPRPSPELEALRHDKVSPEGLAAAGDGDPNKAPASLVAVLGEARPIHNQRVSKLAFSPDSRWLASASDDRTVIMWDMGSGQARRVLRGHSGPVSSVVFHKDGRTLVSASYDGTLKLWPMEKEGEPETLQPNLGEIWAMAVSPDSRFLAAGGKDGGIKLWKWGQWQSPMELATGSGQVTTLAFCPDGEFLAAGSEVSKAEAPTRLYKTADGKLALTLPGHDNRVNALAFSREGKYLASVGADPKARVWDLAAGKPFAEFAHNLGEGFTVTWAAAGQQLILGARFTGSPVVYDLPSRTATHLAVDLWPVSLALSPDEKVLATGAGNGNVFWLDTKGWKQTRLQGGHRHFVTSVAFSPDGKTILSGGTDNTVRRWDLSRPGQNQIVADLASQVNLVAFGPEGKTFAAALRFNMILWDADTAKERFHVSEPYEIHILASSKDGKTLAGSGGDNTVRLWDVGLGKEVHRFAPMGHVNGLGFSADGLTLAAASFNKNCVNVWNVASGAEVGAWHGAFQGTSRFISQGATFSPDGRLLAAGHEDGTITLWDVAQGLKKQTLRGHTKRVNRLKFTHDSRTLVSSADDGTIRLWNPEAERALEVIALGPANCPLSFDLDSSGKYLVAGGNSPVIFVLRLP